MLSYPKSDDFAKTSSKYANYFLRRVFYAESPALFSLSSFYNFSNC